MKPTSTLTVAFSNHRPEIIPLAVAKMRRHALVLLEEPPEAGFISMLRGDLPVDDYLMGIDTEYPEFGRQMNHALRVLYREGIHLRQVEPFLEKLIQIHERLSGGLRPADLQGDPCMWAVYEAERRATGALIGFYEATAAGNFESLLGAVKTFAREDARRFELRDRLRAEAVCLAVRGYDTVYVEAGQMHVGLAQAIRHCIEGRFRVTSDYLMAAVARSMAGAASVFGPGDILTLLYRFKPAFEGPLADLLAARALIQNKIIVKDEIGNDIEWFPHTRDELETNRLVGRLGLADCRRLLPLIEREDAPSARRLVAEAVERISAQG